MLSIIISSNNEAKFLFLKRNIEDTIGAIKFEIIKIDNPGEIGLSEAYNKGGELAKYNYFLFLHDDIKFLTQNWGRALFSSFGLENLGVIGLAGGRKKAKLPTGHDLGLDKYRCVFVSHSPKEKFITENTPIKIKTLDGVFLALTRERWLEFKFNETIKGFHFYDLDLTLRVSEKYQNYIIPNILIQHFSMGNFNNHWINASLEFHRRKYNYDHIDSSEISQIRKFWYQRLLKEDITLKNKLKYAYKMGVDEFSKRSLLNFLLKK